MTVLVIGAGIIGTAVADALARRGLGVTVLDMRGPGRGATVASAGVLAPHLEAHDDRPFLELAVRSLARYDGFIADLRARVTRPIEYARTGTLQVALTEPEADALRADREALARRRIQAEWIEHGALQTFESAVTSQAVVGLFTPEHGFVGVTSLVQALLESSRLAGAAYEQAVEVMRVEPGADQVTVTADRRTYTADWVVVAAGSWANRIRMPGLRMPVVRPIRGQLLQLAWSGVLPRRSVWGTACYTVPWSDGSLLVGATVEDVGFDERSTVAGVDGLAHAVRELLPAAGGAALTDIRVGLRPATPDGLPWIGPLDGAPRVVWAAGHYRNGVLLAPLTADLVSGLIADGTHDPALVITSPNRPSVL